MSEYFYNDHELQPDPAHQPMYLSKVLGILEENNINEVLDVGCGDGNFAESISQTGIEVLGIDLSESGIEIAKSRDIGQFVVGSIYDNYLEVLKRQSKFDAIYSVEVIEHLYDPKRMIFQCNQALNNGGILIITTPYWGYLKNIALSLSNRIDRALTVGWDGGHIKHFSKKTLTTMVENYGFKRLTFSGCGRRLPFLWNGMLLSFQKVENLEVFNRR